MRRALLASLLACLLSPAPLAEPWLDEVADLVAELTRSRDDADPASIRKLADLRSKAALDGLLSVYDRMGSVFMKREVVRALPRFDGVAEAEQGALQKLMDVATTSEEPELREAAIAAIGECRKLGKGFLEMIVESGADDQVREAAMRLHVSRSDAADAAWYRKLFEKERKREEPRRKEKKKEDEDLQKDLLVHKLAAVRELAFEALAPSLSAEELEEACSDGWWRIRALALEQLAEKDARRAERRATAILERNDERSESRAAAAAVLVRIQGAKAGKALIDIADKNISISPLALKLAIADLLAGIDDARLESSLTRRVGKGKGADEHLWLLRATRNADDKDLYKSAQKLLRDKDPDVRIAACRFLGYRRERDALEELGKLVEKGKEEPLVAAALDAISAIREGDPEWQAQLLQLARRPETEIRNAALMQLGSTPDPARVEVLAAALEHPQWSTRLAAAQGLGRMRVKEAVPLLIARLPKESGRMLQELATVLFELTGLPYRTAHGNWKAWWEREGPGFEVISLEALDRRRAEEEERRLRQVTNVKFFGIRIISHRVIFIIDVSGSMAEHMRPAYVSQKTSETRMSVAQRELKKCIDGLDRNALFNIIAFSSGAEGWLDSITSSSQKSRDDARAWVDRLGPFGATNLYDSLQLAFRDPEVDTIFLLSDGEPTAGAQVDPDMIREHVRQWNAHRGVIINSISIGLQLRILQALAEDTGGQYVQFF